jgi:hypothetical protein
MCSVVQGRLGDAGIKIALPDFRGGFIAVF